MNVQRHLGLAGAAIVCAMTFGITLQSAYRGHASDADVNAILAAYPAAKGTANDACSTCHRSGDVADPAQPGTRRSENHCDFCHVVFVSGKRPVIETLNAYGKAYLAAGRSEAAVKAMGGRDADGDGSRAAPCETTPGVVSLRACATNSSPTRRSSSSAR